MTETESVRRDKELVNIPTKQHSAGQHQSACRFLLQIKANKVFSRLDCLAVVYPSILLESTLSAICLWGKKPRDCLKTFNASL